MIKKVTPPKSGASGIRTAAPDDATLRFSFQFFDGSDAEVCPETFAERYTRALMERLKAISGWKVSEFLSSRSKSVRIHTIAWSDTSRPAGFAHLPEHFQDTAAYQFSLSANEHGRVHGLLIDSTFYVVWLDCNHALYP